MFCIAMDPSTLRHFERKLSIRILMDLRKQVLLLLFQESSSKCNLTLNKKKKTIKNLYQFKIK